MKLYFQFFEFKQLPPKIDMVAMGIWDFKAPRSVPEKQRCERRGIRNSPLDVTKSYVLCL